MVSHCSHRSWRIDMQRSELPAVVRESLLQLAISTQATRVAVITIRFMSDYVLFCTTSHITSFLSWAFQQIYAKRSCLWRFFFPYHCNISSKVLAGFFPLCKNEINDKDCKLICRETSGGFSHRFSSMVLYKCFAPSAGGIFQPVPL